LASGAVFQQLSGAVQRAAERDAEALASVPDVGMR
jgi:hypothetical protein